MACKGMKLSWLNDPYKIIQIHVTVNIFRCGSVFTVHTPHIYFTATQCIRQDKYVAESGGSEDKKKKNNVLFSKEVSHSGMHVLAQLP